MNSAQIEQVPATEAGREFLMKSEYLFSESFANDSYVVNVFLPDTKRQGPKRPNECENEYNARRIKIYPKHFINDFSSADPAATAFGEKKFRVFGHFLYFLSEGD